MLEALLKLQSIESQLSQVRSRLRARQNAVRAQQRKIDQLRVKADQLHEKLLGKRSQADSLDLDLKEKEAEVSKLRTSLNTARTNKEYAAILTQINTFKADNAKVEEVALAAMQEVDSIRAEADAAQAEIASEGAALETIARGNAEEVARLEGMLADLQAQRADAEAGVAPATLDIFNRMAERYDGEGMAVIQVQGKKPPFDYTCGGCFMGLNAEHVNALQVTDQVRTCDNCGRILHLDPNEERTRV
jgi:predicted  nucleic acid-binding Zn-ribbon protein